MTAWSSRAKKPIEMRRTPWASGGTMTSSMRPGGALMPSMRGIEKPHTSASTAATRRPRLASAIERLVVTDDLPTPPLPDATARMRVRESVNGLTRGGGCWAWDASTTCSGLIGATPLRSRPNARISSSVMSRRSTSTRSMPSTSPTDSMIRRRNSAREASPGRGTATATTAVRPSTATPCTMPSSTMDRRSSGSCTVARAAWRSSGSGLDGGVDVGIKGLPEISTTCIGRIGPMDPEALTADEFTSVVSAVTNAFGDPTRREIYLFARDAGTAGVTAGAVAEQFDLHPNVARHHLEKLTGGGYLMVEVGRAVDGLARAAGRPAKRDLAGPLDATLALPLKHDELLGGLLARALDALGTDQAERLADEVGFEYGITLASRMDPTEGHRSVRAALSAVADALTAHGFAAHTEARDGGLAIVSECCPFGETAQQYPHVVCALDRGMIRGMLAGLYGETSPQFETSRPDGGDHCVARV